MIRIPRDAAWLAIAPLLLGGLLPMHPGISERWCIAGRWIFPVGDPRALGRVGPNGEPPFQVTRNVLSRPGERHAGADLSNRTSGDTVRAAAHGIVVAAKDAGNGYGLHVVLAHRQPDGTLLLTVYAHLAPGSVRVSPGESVPMGAALGRVGRTGDATSPHLHFELRRPAVWGERWEKAERLDPVQFVATRLPTRDLDSTWARPYLQWAECAGIIRPDEGARTAVTRERWWRAMASARARDGDLLEYSPPPDPDHDASAPVTWKEIVRDLERARKTGLCLPADSTGADRLERDCDAHLGSRHPSRHARGLGDGRAICTMADLALLLSDASRH
jgi:hypothetical protein